MAASSTKKTKAELVRENDHLRGRLQEIMGLVTLLLEGDAVHDELRKWIDKTTQTTR